MTIRYYLKRNYKEEDGQTAIETAIVTDKQVLLDTVECFLEKGFEWVEIGINAIID